MANSHDSPSADPLMYSPQLDWWLRCRDADCGYRSSLGGQIATLERGGVYAAASTDLYSSSKCALSLEAPGAFARDRMMFRRWRLLARAAQATHIEYYLACALEDSPIGRRRFPLGFEPQFGRLSGVVLYQNDAVTLAKLIKAVQHAAEKQFENRADGKISAAIKRAEKAVRAAHAAFYDVCAAEADEDSEDREPCTASWQPPDLDQELQNISTMSRPARRGNDGVWRQVSAA